MAAQKPLKGLILQPHNRNPQMLYHKTYLNDASDEWVVFIHGAGGSSVVWYKQIQAYCKHFNLLLLDLRGHGKSADGSSMQRPDYSFESIALDIIDVLDHLKIRQAHFVGVSLGTIIIQKIAEIRKDYVKSMIMVGAITRMNFRSRFFVNLGQIFHKVMPYMWLYRFFAFIIMPRDDAKESRNIFVQEAQKIARKEFIRWFMLTRRLTARLKKMDDDDIGVPVLYVMGEQDHMFLQPIRERVKKFKNQTLAVVEKCGHVVNIEKAAHFNDISIGFIHQLAPQPAIVEEEQPRHPCKKQR
jgi:pimeloyl-ACP methyl ester carboxylesterase